MLYKKGSIVPRRFFKLKHRKAQHVVKFGCDVEIIGRKITVIGADHKSGIIHVTRSFIGKNPKLYVYRGVVDCGGTEFIGNNSPGGCGIKLEGNNISRYPEY